MLCYLLDMRISAEYINFGNTTKTRSSGNLLIKEEFNDSNVRILYEERDAQNDRFIRQNRWNDKGEQIQNWWFEYFENKKVEHFEEKGNQSYVRTMMDKVVNGLKVHTEEYISKTHPQNNYIHEITKDAKDKLISFVCNGKRVL